MDDALITDATWELAGKPIVSTARYIGISGSRRPDDWSLKALGEVVNLFHPRAYIYVGKAPNDGDGIDGVARWALEQRGHPYICYPSPNRKTYELIKRSSAMASALGTAHPSGLSLLLAFPGKGCHPRVVPCTTSAQAFNGGGSGTWATSALVAGAQANVLVFLPPGLTPPDNWGRAWQQLIPHWWYLEFGPLAPVP